jgi:hypothetical protein
VAVATKMQQIQLIDQTFFFEKLDGAINGDQVYAGINLPLEFTRRMNSPLKLPETIAIGSGSPTR